MARIAGEVPLVLEAFRLKYSPIPDGEAARLQVVNDTGIMHSGHSADFDAITRLAAQILDCPIALISIVGEDEQWFKSNVGLDAVGTTREDAFCGHTIMDTKTMIVSDARQDDRFTKNPLVLGEPKIVFYAGVPISIDGNHNLGTLCVIDKKPRQISDKQLEQLRGLAKVAEGLIGAFKGKSEMKKISLLEKHKSEDKSKTAILLEQVKELSGIGGWELKMEPISLTWTDETKRIHEVPLDYVPDLDEAVQFYAPEARAAINNGIETAMSDGSDWDLELPLTTALGNEIWVRAVGRPIYEDGIVTSLIGAFQDITARRKSDQALQDSEKKAKKAQQRLWDAIEALPEAFVIYDAEDRLVISNTKYKEIYAASLPAIFEGAAFEDIIKFGIDNGQYPQAEGQEAAFLKERLYRHRNPSGPMEQSLPGDTFLQVHEVQTKDGDTVGFRTDVTELRRQKRALEKQANALEEQAKALVKAKQDADVATLKMQRLALIAQSTTDSIITTDENVNITWVNPAFTQMTGYSLDEVMGKNPAAILNGPSTDPDTVQDIAMAGIEGREVRVEIENHHKDGSAIWIETDIKPIFDQDGHFLMNLSVQRDVTVAKKQAEKLKDALIEAKSAAETKSNFLATMSHEIRTPMNGVIGMADLLGQTNLDEHQSEFVDTICQSGEALLGIINDILDFSKLDGGKMEIESSPFSVQETFSSVKKLMSPIAQEKGLDLRLAFKTKLPEYLLGDSGRIRQILLNLIGNAIKFTAEGSVSIDISHAETERGIEVRIKITDTGIGIPIDRLDRIFEQFAQAEEDTSRRFGGTGLGLSISRLLAQRMGGDIYVTSEENKGSIFETVFYLEPTKATDFTQVASQQSVSVDFLSGKSILVAEDNRTNRLLIKKMLADTNANVTFAQDGVLAIEKFSSMSPDLILMDISMPHKDGKQATLEIRDIEQGLGRTRVPIIALTANAFKEDREACFAAGMDGFLTKPIRKATLNAELNRVWNLVYSKKL